MAVLMHLFIKFEHFSKKFYFILICFLALVMIFLEIQGQKNIFSYDWTKMYGNFDICMEFRD